jgi:hypothetical protein
MTFFERLFAAPGAPTYNDIFDGTIATPLHG